MALQEFGSGYYFSVFWSVSRALGALPSFVRLGCVYYCNARATDVFPTPGYPFRTMNGAACISDYTLTRGNSRGLEGFEEMSIGNGSSIRGQQAIPLEKQTLVLPGVTRDQQSSIPVHLLISFKCL